MTSLVLSESFGVVLAFTFGHFFNFYMVPIFVISIMTLFTVLITFFPETPTFLVKQHKYHVCYLIFNYPNESFIENPFLATLLQQAEESVRFYHNLSEGYKEDKQVKIEISKLMNKIHQDEEESKKKTFKWSDLTTVPVQRAFTIGIVLIILNELSGFAAMLNYTANIFEEAGSNLHPNVSAIVIGVIGVFGTVVATNLVDRAGRKVIIFFFFQ